VSIKIMIDFLLIMAIAAVCIIAEWLGIDPEAY